MSNADKKPAETDKMKADPLTDTLPSDAELDALQAEIDQALKKAAQHGQGENQDMDKDEPATDTELDIARQRIETLEAELANAKDQTLRALAEAENVKRRAEREVADAKLYGINRFAEDVLSVVDNLGRAISTLDGKTREDLGENSKNLLEGIELTEKNLMAILARHGIKAVPGKGAKFDPKVHQAVAQIPSDQDKDHIAEVMQTGFTIGGRTLRAAIVAVSTGPVRTA